jgi:4-hydroxy-3-methylbut-2-enyl diphosphate reductase
MVEELHLARPRGFCAGVVMAIEAVERAADADREAGGRGLAVYHAIVHNRTVVERLERERGVRFVERVEDIGDPASGAPDTVVFSAHGVAPDVRRRAAEAGLATIDATCPLVTKVHTEARKFAAREFTILLIADSPEHQEVVGIVGEAPDRIVPVHVDGDPAPAPGLADPRSVQVADPAKVVVLTQTTLNVDRTVGTVRALRARFPDLVVPSRDDLCYATRNRQDAVRRIAPRVDLFLVVTSTTSSNGTRLVELARELTGRAIRIETAADLEDAWFRDVRAVGVTSAASTPDDLVQAVVRFFRDRNPALSVREDGEPETVEFRAPRRVPPSAVS